MLKVKFIHVVLLAVITRSTSGKYEYISGENATAGASIEVCFYIKTGDSKSCKTFHNFAAIEEFMSTPHVKVEIHDQVLTKVHKYSFSRVMYTKELVIWNCGLVEIEARAFHGSLSFLKFDIQRNGLETVKTGVFNDLLITHLHLGHNKIKTIEEDALSYMQNIEEVNLVNNLISTYDWKWFYKTPLLKSLCFQNNTIKVMPERAFRNLIDRPRVLNVFLSFNEINFIHPMAFDTMANTTIGKLYLDHNMLETWNEALSMNINELKISFNNIKCLYGDLHSTIKNNSLQNFIENPYSCDCLKEIKTVGDQRRETSDWFMKEYLRCRGDKKTRYLKMQGRRSQNIKIFSSP